MPDVQQGWTLGSHVRGVKSVSNGEGEPPASLMLLTKGTTRSGGTQEARLFDLSGPMTGTLCLVQDGVVIAATEMECWGEDIVVTHAYPQGAQLGAKVVTVDDEGRQITIAQAGFC
jgi:hypothetical protein